MKIDVRCGFFDGDIGMRGVVGGCVGDFERAFHGDG